MSSHLGLGLAAIVAGGAIVIAILRLPPPGPRSPSRAPWRPLLGVLWLVGAGCTVVATTPYLWRGTVPQPFAAFGVAAGVALLCASVGTAARSGRLAVFGLLLAVIGWATVWFLIGVVLAPAGVVLYVVGLARGRFVERRLLATAAGLAAVAIATVFFAPLPVPYWSLAAAAGALGVGVTIS